MMASSTRMCCGGYAAASNLELKPATYDGPEFISVGERTAEIETEDQCAHSPLLEPPITLPDGKLIIF
jgi:hypothetical protein